jgi:phosphopantothenate synthetase
MAAVRLSEIMASSGDQITSIDLNPVMVGVKGEGVTIVDALVERNLRPVAAQ